jgi:shikimate kinase
MAAGKTTLGLALAERLEVKFLDSDQVLLELTGKNAAEIAADLGVTRLHELEEGLVSAALSSPDPLVVAAAASVVDDVMTREKLSRHLCLWVEADSAMLAERRGSGLHRRNMTDEEAIELNRVRRLSVADFVIGQIDTTTSTVEQSVDLALSIISPHMDRFKDS